MDIFGLSVLLICLSITIMVVMHFIFKNSFTVVELIWQSVATIFILLLIVFVGSFANTYDTMYVNGKVVDKEVVRKNCENHNYWSDYSSNNCRTEYTRTKSYSCKDADGNRKTCHKTQYRSKYPWEQFYYVNTSLERSFEIDRVDDRGTTIPDRYSVVKKDDPVTISVSYTNYIQAASDSLFSEIDVDNEEQIIERGYIYDYYKTKNVFSTTNLDVTSLEEHVDIVNSRLTSGANLGIVFTDDAAYAEKLKRAWNGLEINDFMIVLTVNGDKIIKAKVISWSKETLVNVVVEDMFNMTSLKTSEFINILPAIETKLNELYIKPSSEDFEYLKEDIKMPIWVILLGFLIVLVVTPTVSYFLSKE